MYRNRFTDVAIVLAVFTANLLVVFPYATRNLSATPWNNDYAYCAMARLFRTLPWTWNPLWYCGAPFRYIYPPLFHVFVAGAPLPVGRAFHLVSAISYALVPVACYVLGWALFQSRSVALVAAAAYSFFPSPVYLLTDWADAAQGYHHAPWPFVALVAHAESPHTAALAASLFGLAAIWRGRNITAVICLALVFLLNWAGLRGLAPALVAVVIAKGREQGYGRSAKLVFAVLGCAYGLSAFWITAGFVRNVQLFGETFSEYEIHQKPWSTATWLVIGVTLLLLALAFWRRISPVAAFCLAWVAVSGAPILALAIGGDALFLEPHRGILEFNAALLFGLCASLAAAPRVRWAALAVGVAGLVISGGFLRHAWELQPESTRPQELPAFQISDWLAQNAPQERVVAAGELNGALNLWTNVAQTRGGHQGISNLLTLAAHREMEAGCTKGPDASRLTELWMRALNARMAVVHGPASQEHFHWFTQPEKFAAFPVAWTDGRGDTIYRLPGAFDEAVVVDLDAETTLPKMRSSDDAAFLEAYVRWAAGKRAARVHWDSTGRAEIAMSSPLAPREAVLLKINNDAGWRSNAGSKRDDPIGFLLIELPAGTTNATVDFHNSWDVWLGCIVPLATLAALLARLPLWRIAIAVVIPTALAFAILASSSPPRNTIAEDAYRRIHPPMINPGVFNSGVFNSGVFNPGGAPVTLRRGQKASIYGTNLGATGDAVRVLVGDREAPILYRSFGQIDFTVPSDGPSPADLSVEVNGCRGNAFEIRIAN